MKTRFTCLLFLTAPYVIGSDHELYEMPLADLLELKLIDESLNRALQEKQGALIVKDVIFSEDIADFPDLNLAESIQRMPAVAITREGNEGRQISLRGVGPTFTQVQINGMETFAKTSSPMDSRGAVMEDRAFDFNVFASEMFSQINLLKSYTAKHDEGGIGGTVSLITPKPFDADKPFAGVSVLAGQNELTSDISPRLAGIVSNSWERFGVLFSCAYSQRDIVERGFNTTRWRQRQTLNYSDTLDADLVQSLEEGELWFARGNRYSVWENTQERIGANLALQIRPLDNVDMGITFFHAQLNNDRHEWHLSTRGSSITALGRVEDLEVFELNGHKEVIYGEFSDVTLRTESRIDKADTDYSQVVWDASWKVNHQLSFSGLLGWSKSEFDQPISDKVYYETRAPAGITTDFRQNRFYARNTYAIDTAESSLWEVSELDQREDLIVDEFENVKLDSIYLLDNESLLEFGGSFKRYAHEGNKWENNNFIQSQEAPINNERVDVEPFYVLFSGSDDADWAAADVRAAQRFYGLDTSLDRSDDSRKIEEETQAFYFQYTQNQTLFKRLLAINIGARWFETQVRMGSEINSERFFSTHSYSYLLPSINTVLELSEKWFLRTGISQNINRNRLLDLGLYGRVDTENRRILSGSGGIDLSPFHVTNFDASIEWYGKSSDFFAITLFNKEIDNFNETVTSTVPFGETGIPVTVLESGQDENTLFQYTRLESKADATIRGVEFSFKSGLSFFPTPFNRLGVIGNVTLAEGEATYNNVQNTGKSQKKDFIGLSEVSGNLSLIYEYQRWGGRLSVAYRDDYISRVESGNADEDERGFHESTHFDFSAYYAFSENWKVVFEGVNLTDETETQYSDSNDRAYNTTKSGRAFFAGIKYKFL